MVKRKISDKQKAEIYHEIGHVAEMLSGNINNYITDDLEFLGDAALAKKGHKAAALLADIYQDAMRKSMGKTKKKKKK